MFEQFLLARIRVGLSHVGQAFQPAISECRLRVAGWKACPTIES